MATVDPKLSTGDDEPPARALTTPFVLVLAASCGVAAANLYYAQPLLESIARAFHTGSGTAGLIVTCSQIGYAIGLGFLVPIGDLLSRRRLVPILLAVDVVALLVSAVAPDIGSLIALALLVGTGAAAAQVLVPLAASLSDDESRGRVVGTVMTGLLLGILLARTLSGLIAGASSWRVVYVVAAGLVAVMAVVLSRVIPPERSRPQISYGQLLRTTGALFLALPALRRRAWFGAVGFASFSVFWTTYGFMLSGPHYHYSDIVIGLFGLVGAGGALAASSAGRLADRGHARIITIGCTALVLASFVPVYLGRTSLSALIVGIVVLDIGVQGLQVTNQSVIYGLAPEARSRVNACYMVSYFAGGAVGSALAGALYDADGWAGVCVLGGVFALLGLLAQVYDLLRPARSHPDRVAAALSTLG